MNIEISTIVTIIIILYLCFQACRSVKVAAENERLAVVTLGKFEKLLGPGLLIIWSSDAKKLTRLSLRQKGEYVGDGIALFGGEALPVFGGNLNPGDAVNISSLRDSKIWVSSEGPLKKGKGVGVN